MGDDPTAFSFDSLRFRSGACDPDDDSLPIVSASPAAPTVGQLLARVRPHRVIDGIAAVLMPFDAAGRPDFAGFARQVERVAAAGLTPAVNMTRAGSIGRRRATRRGAGDRVPRSGGTRAISWRGLRRGREWPDARTVRSAIYASWPAAAPPFSPLHRAQSASGASIVTLFRELAAHTPGILAFELGQDFVPFGRIFEPDTIRGLLDSEGVLGLKHSSLRRDLEWERLALRDERRPEFKVYTGNDLAIDMVMYGSDYLLGLSAFAPEAFARRDRYWREGDGRFHALNDVLQYLGAFAFRAPTPAYRHSAAQFLKITGHLAHDEAPAGTPRRPDSDVRCWRTSRAACRPDRGG